MKNFIKNFPIDHAKSDIFMTHTDTIKNALQTLREKYDDHHFQQQFQDYSKIIKLTFTDIQEPYIININQGKITYLSNNDIENPDITVTTDSTVFLDIVNKKMSPMIAYATGKLTVKGKLTDLIRLQKLF